MSKAAVNSSLGSDTSRPRGGRIDGCVFRHADVLGKPMPVGTPAPDDTAERGCFRLTRGLPPMSLPPLSWRGAERRSNLPNHRVCFATLAMTGGPAGRPESIML